MPDNLRVTVPIPQNTGVGRVQPQRDPTALGQISPDRVTPPNAKEQQQSQGGGLDNTMLARDSSFTQFVQQLRQTPALAESLQKIMFDIFSRKDELRTGGAVNTLLRQLAEGMDMDKAEILKNLMFQQTNSTRFSGEVFGALRQMQKEFKGTDFDLHLANFLKAFDGFFSIGDTSTSIRHELDEVLQMIPRSSADPVKQAAQEMNFEQPVRLLSQNLEVLKEKVIPLLGDYVARANDFGRARDQIALLVHDIARLNLSSREALAEKFSVLMDFCRFGLNMPEERVADLQTLFSQEVARQTSGQQNKLVDSLVQLLQDGTAQEKLGKSGSGTAVFRDVSTALLMDNSVYMPFTHAFLPVNYQGQFMFGELWVEKDTEHTPPKIAGEAPGKRVYLTFDIKNLGSFEAVLLVNGKNVSMNLKYPQNMPGKRGEISDSLARIFAENGLTMDQLLVTNDQPIQVQKLILQKVYDGRNTVDVTV